MPIVAGPTMLLMPGRTGCLRYIREPLVMSSPKPSSWAKAYPERPTERWLRRWTDARRRTRSFSRRFGFIFRCSVLTYISNNDRLRPFIKDSSNEPVPESRWQEHAGGDKLTTPRCQQPEASRPHDSRATAPSGKRGTGKTPVGILPYFWCCSEPVRIIEASTLIIQLDAKFAKSVGSAVPPSPSMPILIILIIFIHRRYTIGSIKKKK